MSIAVEVGLLSDKTAAVEAGFKEQVGSIQISGAETTWSQQGSW